MPLVLQPATEENARKRAEVQFASYADHPVLIYGMKDVSHQDKVSFFMQLRECEVGKPWVREMEIVDTDNGRVAAMARWSSPTTMSEDGHQKFELPRGTNEALVRSVSSISSELEGKYWDKENMHSLIVMNVHPDYQRRGLGQRLMEQGLEVPDGDGLQTFLLASDEGKRLYTKYGFETMEEKAFDLASWGVGGERRTRAMIRRPKVDKETV